MRVRTLRMGCKANFAYYAAQIIDSEERAREYISARCLELEKLMGA